MISPRRLAPTFAGGSKRTSSTERETTTGNRLSCVRGSVDSSGVPTNFCLTADGGIAALSSDYRREMVKLSLLRLLDARNSADPLSVSDGERASQLADAGFLPRYLWPRHPLSKLTSSLVRLER